MKVYLDSNCVIYLVERNPTWEPRVTAKVTAFQNAGNLLAVSELTRAECLVGPHRSGDGGMLARYNLFFNSSTIHVLPLTTAVCERTARVRAAHSYKLPDAMHLAAAVEHGCGLFLTNDLRLSAFTDIRIEILS